MTGAFPAEALRRAMLSSIPEQLDRFEDHPPDRRFLYIPRAHLRALSFDAPLVQGIPGSGKSSWWAALQSEPHRAVMIREMGARVIDERTAVFAGFGTPPKPESYPGPAALQRLCRDQDPSNIWRAVILHHALDAAARGDIGPPWSEHGLWEDRVAWVASNPERFERTLYQRDRALLQGGERRLVVFDALDRTASDRSSAQRLLRGLLMVLLEMRTYRHIRGKAFVRPDMLASPEVVSFPDASKIVAGDARLSWPRADLFGLLWQHLANAPDGADAFRDGCRRSFGVELEQEGDTWRVPDRLRSDEELQRAAFHALSGPYMGRDPRRGQPFSWLPSRLADVFGQVSPRSFLAALRRAAGEAHEEEPFALSARGLMAGVAAASKIRIAEVAEDSPWAWRAADALRGLALPCPFAEVKQRWAKAGLLDTLRSEENRPQHLDQGEEGVRRDLEDLGLLERMSDGRVNMPDVYRIGLELRRKGGVRRVR